jgi:hypothetical protein
LQAACSPGWFAVTVHAQSPPASVIAVAVSVWVCMASTVTTTPVRSKQGQQVSYRGDLVALRGEGDLPQDGTGGVVERRDQVRRAPLPATSGPGAAYGLAVDRDDPSAIDQVRAGPHECPDLLVEFVGVEAGEQLAQGGLIRCGLDPEPAKACSGRSATQSPIAANERAPANTALTATASTPIRCRRAA